MNELDRAGRYFMRVVIRAAALLLLLVPGASVCRAATADEPSGTLFFSDGTKKHIFNFTINGCLYRKINTGFAFPPPREGSASKVGVQEGEFLLLLATEKGALEVPVQKHALQKITFLPTAEKGSDPGSVVFKVRVYFRDKRVMYGRMAVGNIPEHKYLTKTNRNCWALTARTPEDRKRLEALRTIVFDPPPRPVKGKNSSEEEDAGIIAVKAK